MNQAQAQVQGALSNIWKITALREKILFTIAMIAIYRFGVHVPMPGIDHEKFSALMGGGNVLAGFLDLFSGGGLARFSVFALGITPYINASIIMQLMTSVIPKLEELQKEGGEAGRKKIQQWTRYFTIVLAGIQAIGISNWLWASGVVLEHMPGKDPFPYMFFAVNFVTLIAGTIFIMWLGELITERGIGNGASILIMVSILAAMPTYVGRTSEGVEAGSYSWISVGILVLAYLAILVAIVIVQEGARRIPVQAAKRQVGGRLHQGRMSYIPFKINQGGVMPIIFASSLMLFPYTVSSWFGSPQPKIPSVDWGKFFTPLFWTWENVKNAATEIGTRLIAEMSGAGAVYNIMYFALIVFFSYFYASLVLNPAELANNLKKYGNFIPGYRPGKPTAEYLEGVLNRITFMGAIFLGTVALLPNFVESWTNVRTFQGLGSTALLIMVGVAVDLYNQLQTHLLSRQYEGFMK